MGRAGLLFADRRAAPRASDVPELLLELALLLAREQAAFERVEAHQLSHVEYLGLRVRARARVRVGFGIGFGFGFERAPAHGRALPARAAELLLLGAEW